MDKFKVSDLIANYLADSKIEHVFGIIGAGNAHIFDSIATRGFTEIVCVHHEQAAIMAMIGYYRTTGKKSAVLLTTGAGSTNGTTGVVSAWMDSVPGVIIAGNENSKFTKDENHLRIWGTQGYDSVSMVQKVTKYAKRITDPNQVIAELDNSFKAAFSGRFGPSWIEIPMDMQSSMIVKNEKVNPVSAVVSEHPDIRNEISKLQQLINGSERPLLWLGHGVRAAGAAREVESFVNKLGIPTLVSWAGIDLLDVENPFNFGSAGVYGQRAANFILQNCDLLITIGTRLAIPQVGYDLSEFARAAKIVVNDIDPLEANKHGTRISLPIVCDAGYFMGQIAENIDTSKMNSATWLTYCKKMKSEFPRVGIEHADKNGYINSYTFMDKLSNHLYEDAAVVTDMGTALLSGHQVLKIKKGQRLLTSTGLGEMGFGLPAAIGMSIGGKNKKVICLNCDGGMMLNLQELQTMVHHKLPIKLFIFNNDGYLMIKHTQKALFKGRYSGTEKKSGVSCPDYEKLAKAFDLPYLKIKTWEDFERNIPIVLSSDTAYVCEVFMDPEQPLVPKLSLAIQADGSIVSPPLEDLSPLIPRSVLQKSMLIGIHEKSKNLV